MAYLACEDPFEVALYDAVAAAAEQMTRDRLIFQAELLQRAVFGDGGT